MGCHTWFYRKIERTQKEAKQSCLKKLIYDEKLNINILENRSFNGIDWSNYTEEELIKFDTILKRKIRMVKNNLCQKTVWNNQNDKELTVYVEGKGLFIEDTGFHDVFRKYGYPDDKLFSLKESLDYINNTNNDCVIYEDTVQRLTEFWNKFKNGMIEFG